MPIPFAILSSDDEHVWNLQYYFWKNAMDHFDTIKNTDYNKEGVFEVDACMAIVLAGTSISQLLGQNVGVDSSGKTDGPRAAFRKLTSGKDLKSIGFGGLKKRFEGFVTVYDDIRHFGLSLPKHRQIRDINEQSLCEFLTTAQDVWKLVAKLLGAASMPHSEDFQHTFAL